MIVKILGAIDIIAAISFLMLIFGVDVFSRFIIFCAALLVLKGAVFVRDVLSIFDIIASIILLISLIAAIPAILLWIPAFLLLAKGFASFF